MDVLYVCILLIDRNKNLILYTSKLMSNNNNSIINYVVKPQAPLMLRAV